ncbi:MAG: AAA family ATPase, partial [Acidobacteriota bacterium]|nr:AAA family ATPase [Acidobacteriota bacterium]
ARTDAGDRLLFTMARLAADGSPERLTAHLQVWDLVEHDDVLRRARRNRAPEAEFLELPALAEFDIHEPPPFPDAAFQDIAAPGDDADPLLHFLLPPDILAPASHEDIEGGVRWYRLESAALAGDDQFQRLFDTGGDELELKLTRDQYEILRAPGPVLLAGSAGSGKTTIAIHRLVQAARLPGAPPCLYLSYSAALVEHARALYHNLAGPELTTGGSPRAAPDFSTFGDLYRSMIPRELLEHQARPMTEPLFREWFQMAGRPLDPALVWEELRSILKGACLSPLQPMLDPESYYELGRKRAPLFVEQRPEIYRIAQRYQEWLAEEGRSDRIDLCRRALAALRRRRTTGYEVVVCDEVQDLTELEISFVLSLSARPSLSGVLLAGDTQQIVNPSGFRWAEVRRLAAKVSHQKTAPPVLRLRRNLRSVLPLVELANALLHLRREVYGRSEEDEPQEGVAHGPVPVAIPAAEDDVLEAIAGFGPHCAVLVLDDHEGERLKRRLATSRVFHVREAKGLEFDTVVLWKLLEPDRDLLDRFGRGDSRLEREPRFARLLRHLYVAVTRARRHLAIHDGMEPHPFWSQERFRGLIERELLDSVSHLFRATASPAEWRREGEYFSARGHPRQAAECYRRAGLLELETEELAKADEARGDWSGALARWTRLGVPAREAPILEHLGRLPEALSRYRAAGLEDEARRCELELLEGRRAW